MSNAQNTTDMNTGIIYNGEIRIEENGSKSATCLSLLIDDITCIELSLAEFNTLSDELENGEVVSYLGYDFIRQYRRGGAVYNARPVQRRRRKVAY